jgi:hemolysin III
MERVLSVARFPCLTPFVCLVVVRSLHCQIMNGITHGLGVLLSLIGGYLLYNRVRDMSYVHHISCAVYTTSLLALYMSSTLYHSFYALQHAKYVFMVFDKCAIYILIAGTYTPFLQIMLVDKPIWSVGLLGFIWVCCFLGISVEAFYPTWRYRPMFSLAMYLGMGWACIVCLPEMKSRMPIGCINLILLGGVGYTVGVPFFVRNNNLDHAIWHLFVMAGSIFHWFAIYLYVAPRSLDTIIGVE